MIKLNKDTTIFNSENGPDTKFFIGINQPTLNTIYLANHGNILYSQILPASDAIPGDGTVPRKSVPFPEYSLPTWCENMPGNSIFDCVDASHAEIPGKDHDDIIRFITNGNAPVTISSN